MNTFPHPVQPLTQKRAPRYNRDDTLPAMQIPMPITVPTTVSTTVSTPVPILTTTATARPGITNPLVISSRASMIMQRRSTPMAIMYAQRKEASVSIELSRKIDIAGHICSVYQAIALADSNVPAFHPVDLLPECSIPQKNVSLVKTSVIESVIDKRRYAMDIFDKGRADEALYALQESALYIVNEAYRLSKL